MGTWLTSLIPDEYVSSVYDIDLDRLWHQGKRLLLTDLDNTLVPWNEPNTPESLVVWLQAARERGFEICIVSNNKGPRVKAFAEAVDVDWIGAARKPGPSGFREALERFRKAPAQVVMVGDQLFTDIRGAKRLGLYTILVLPLHPREWWGTRLVRMVERPVLERLVRRGLATRPPQSGNTR